MIICYVPCLSFLEAVWSLSGWFGKMQVPQSVPKELDSSSSKSW